ncbi:hypothetical protein CPB84DRAFT_1748141 [Gymnopilus junonius]|uniref:DUF6534 domain-containing protein n=1 Tax=Gymnopilus junonius TaxID=109634 RepID=A0A9P5NIV4_GYMJU|nr:hypothetical protein CPB84DRAFT_1748141 [Gymnopilus junonius]
MTTPVVDIRPLTQLYFPGATLVGTFVTCMLYGLTVLQVSEYFLAWNLIRIKFQTYFYYTYYPKDPTQTKLLVAFIWFIDTLHIVFTHIIIWSLFASVLLNTIIACIVQILVKETEFVSYFLMRIFQLSPDKVRWWVTSIIIQRGLIFLRFYLVPETVTLMLIKKEFAKLAQINFYAATPFAIFAVLSDFMITGALIYFLHGHRTTFRKTNTLVSKLIVYAINRCLLTAIVEIAECIVYQGSTNLFITEFSTLTKSLWFLSIDFVIGKLYANSLLATLNSRRMLTSRHKSTVGSVHMSRLDFRSSHDGASHVIELSNRNQASGSDPNSSTSRTTGVLVISKEGLEEGSTSLSIRDV